MRPGTSFAAEAGAPGGVLHRGNGSDPQTLDFHKSTGVPERWIHYDLFEGLISPDGDNGLIPGVAESWEAGPDGREFTFRLRRDAKWSDGSPVTAHDFVFAWRRCCDPATASGVAYLLWVIENAQAAAMGQAPPDTIGAQALDDHTLAVKLRAPTPHFASMLHHHAFYPINRASFAKHGDDFIRPGNLVSNGAYRLAEFVSQSHVKVTRNPHFHAADSVALETVYFHATENLETEFRRFRAGELHTTFEVPVTQTRFARQNLPDEYREDPFLGLYFYAANLTREPWKSNKDLRLALNLAIDRDAIVEKITGQGERPLFSFVPPGTADYTPQVPDYATWSQFQRDDRARALVAAAGYGAPGKGLELEILYNTNENHRRIAIAIAAMWQSKLGIKVTLNNQEWKVFLASRNGKTYRDVVRQGWPADYNDAMAFLEPLRSDIVQLNPAGYANPVYDRLITGANEAADPQARRELLQQAERVLLDDVPVFPIYAYATQHMVSRRLSGWRADLLGIHPSRFMKLEP